MFCLSLLRPLHRNPLIQSGSSRRSECLYRSWLSAQHVHGSRGPQSRTFIFCMALANCFPRPIHHWDPPIPPVSSGIATLVDAARKDTRSDGGLCSLSGFRCHDQRSEGSQRTWRGYGFHRKGTPHGSGFVDGNIHWKQRKKHQPRTSWRRALLVWTSVTLGVSIPTDDILTDSTSGRESILLQITCRSYLSITSAYQAKCLWSSQAS